MIKISYRDVDQEFSLSPEQRNIKLNLMENISMTLINDAWGEFYRSVASEVDDSMERYIESIYKNDDRYKKVQELDKQWEALSESEKNGKTPSAEADRISGEGIQAEDELDEYKKELQSNMDVIKRAMIAQIIEWKVD